MHALRDAPASPPNILLIVTDQQNIDTIRAHREHFAHPAHGTSWVETPNLDRLARRGTSFLESHVANPVCCPSRSSLFTGRYATETGVTYNNVGIDRSVPNLGQWFERHTDYERVYCGKWHVGGKWNYPTVDGPRKIPGFETLPVGSLGTGDLADYQVSSSVEGFVRSYDGERPFLVVAGLMNPHDICFWMGAGPDPRYIVPGEDVFGLGEHLPVLPPNHDTFFGEPLAHGRKKFTPMQWRNYAHDYYRMVEKVDADVGRMLSAVESRDDETLVIFTSDHGEGLGRHGRVQKWHPYEHSLKVPLVVSLPGRVREGAVDAAHLVNNVDLMSTVCDYAGIAPPPHARGRSLRPLLEGELREGELREGEAPASWRSSLFAEFARTGRVVRTGRYKYVQMYHYSGEPDRPFVDAVTGEPAAFAAGRRLRVHPERLLFDLAEDPWETRNLAGDAALADVLAEHERLLHAYEAELIPGTHYERS